MTPTAKSPTVFISYSHKDEVWKDKLIPHFSHLQMADVLRVWDDRQIKQGEDWYAHIKHVLDETEYAVCLISANFLSSDFCINEEVEYLLQHRRKDGGRRLHILPVLIRDVDWHAHAWLRRLQMLPRDGRNVQTHFRDDPDQVFSEVARTVRQAITGESPFPEPPPPAGTPPRQVDVSRLPETGELLFGRRKTIKLLNDAWKKDSATRVVAFKAWGGVGKSTLVRVWTEQMADDNYRGAEEVFAWSFYSQGTGDRVTSADQFIDAALRFFGEDDPTAGSPWDKGERLARLMAARRTLLLLDGMEPLQDSGRYGRHGAINDPALQTLLVNLARQNPGLCVISTREDVTDLQGDRFTDAVIHRNLEQVDPTAGRALLRVRGIHGTDGQLEQAVTAFGCHALAINLLASYLNETAGGQITAADAIPDIDVPVENGKHPRRVIEAWRQHLGESAEVQLLRILGLFDSPATSGELAAVTAEPRIPGLTDKLPVDTTLLDTSAVERLRQIGLIARASKHRPDILDCHPLIREHFEEGMTNDEGVRMNEEDDSSFILPPSSFREAHRRLYEHLKQSAPELPDNLNDMMPLYYAVAHGCKAAKHKEAWQVYWQRIIKKKTAFTPRKTPIGANLAAVSCFFGSTDPLALQAEESLTEKAKARRNHELGHGLFLLGRTTEAIAPLEKALQLHELIGNQEAWKHAAHDARILREVHLMQGNISAALEDAEQIVQQGEGMRRHRQLYYIWGYWYCECLLRGIQRAARRGEVSSELTNSLERRIEHSVEYSQSVNQPFDIAHDLQIRGRFVLTLGGRYQWEDAKRDLDTAIRQLQKSDHQHHIASAFLDRAALHRSCATNDVAHLSVALADLEQAELIAERGSMLIWQIEAALERTALCRAKFQMTNDKSQIELAQLHLDKARQLVKQTEKPYEPHVPDWEDWNPPEYVGVFKKGDIVGYHCRNDEIERLQAAIDSASGGR